MAHGKRAQHLAVALILGVTILAGTTGAPSSSGRRFLAVDNASGRSLLTVVTDASTAMHGPLALSAGIRLRIYGTQSGRTIRARRIEILD